MLLSILRRAALLPALTSLSFVRPASTMASPPSSFTLDRSIFNQTLYSRMRTFWFGDLAEDASAPDFDAAQKWFGAGKTDEDKAAFDGQCGQEFGHALDAIAADKLALPKFESYEKEIEHASDIAAPFLPDVKDALASSDKEGRQTLLSLILLLDQMPRNIYRDPAGLRKVYTHYDRLAFSLAHAAMRDLPTNLIDTAYFRTRPVYGNWLIMPFVHCEHLPTHDRWYDIVNRGIEASKAEGNEAAVKFYELGVQAEDKHVELLRRFGRYPHRNEALGRETTREEEEWLVDGDTFGVKQTKGKKEDGKDEL